MSPFWRWAIFHRYPKLKRSNTNRVFFKNKVTTLYCFIRVFLLFFMNSSNVINSCRFIVFNLFVCLNIGFNFIVFYLCQGHHLTHAPPQVPIYQHYFPPCHLKGTAALPWACRFLLDCFWDWSFLMRLNSVADFYFFKSFRCSYHFIHKFSINKD